MSVSADTAACTFKSRPSKNRLIFLIPTLPRIDGCEDDRSPPSRVTPTLPRCQPDRCLPSMETFGVPDITAQSDFNVTRSATVGHSRLAVKLYTSRLRMLGGFFLSFQQYWT
jgi:hypothetical protein